ncbi:hypothetical protein [Rhodococcus triatomae]|nr:hypothetical protein G419_19915 [Rhodococcus triatomae BKS 15-14]
MTSRPEWLSRAVEPAYTLVLALVIVGPLLGPGYLLLRDAVSTPRSFLTDSALGLSDAAARAVPQDAAIAVLSAVVDGGLAVKTILVAALWAAGWGAARMVAALFPARGTFPRPSVGVGGRLLAATVTMWNPYVAERLLQGHWSLLTGYAALPWVVIATTRTRRGKPRGWPVLATALAAAGLTPTGAVLASLLALVLLVVPAGPVRVFGSSDYQKRAQGVRRVGIGAALAVVASAPWLVATAVSGAGAEGDTAGVAAFAARAEPWLATTGSLAGLGGIWNADAVPGSRTTPWALIATAILLAVVALGLPAVWRARRSPVVVALAVLAAAAVVVPTLAATGWGLAVGEWAVVHLPGYGLMRDAQKWVALAVPFYALSAAAGVSVLASLARRVFADDPAPTRASRAGAAVVAIGAVLLSLPDLAWGVGGALRPVHYPEAWQRVTALVEGGAGDVAVLPAGTFRRFPWSGDAPVLDPAPRWLPLDVPQTGRLIVLFGGGSTIAGEGDRSAEIERLLIGGGEPGDLTNLGVGWVLVEHDTPGTPGDGELLSALDRVHDDENLTLYRVPGTPTEYAPGTAARVAVVSAHLAWAALLAGGVLGCVAGRGRARRADQP